MRLNVPADQRQKRPELHGMHIGHHGQTGRVIAGAGSGGVWVRFDGQPAHSYIGCPIAWLEPLKESP